MEDTKVTPTAMYNTGWTPKRAPDGTQLKHGHYEVWSKPNRECLYDRDEQRITQIRKTVFHEL